MKVGGKALRSIWREDKKVLIIDQTELPARVRIREIRSLKEIGTCIRRMLVRGAPLIGITAAYGIALAMREDSSDEYLDYANLFLFKTRPTAVNLSNALKIIVSYLRTLSEDERENQAWVFADRMAEEDISQNKQIGENGFSLLEKIYKNKGHVNVLTHCNAGWLATVDFGTALAPIYLAHARGINIHVWVDETRPRNQGLLTAWELANQGIPYTLIVDNAGGHLMQKRMVDIVFVGADRITSKGDVCNKIGTYLKALSAFDNKIPFFVAAPINTIDWEIEDGVRDTPIEERDPLEVLSNPTLDTEKKYTIESHGNPAAFNPAFDITPAKLVSGIITEKKLITPVTKDNMMTIYSDNL